MGGNNLANKTWNGEFTVLICFLRSFCIRYAFLYVSFGKSFKRSQVNFCNNSVRNLRKCTYGIMYVRMYKIEDDSIKCTLFRLVDREYGISWNLWRWVSTERAPPGWCYAPSPLVSPPLAQVLVSCPAMDFSQSREYYGRKWDALSSLLFETFTSLHP